MKEQLKEGAAFAVSMILTLAAFYFLTIIIH